VARSKEPNQEPMATAARPHRATASHHRRRQMPHQAMPRPHPATPRIRLGRLVRGRETDRLKAAAASVKHLAVRSICVRASAVCRYGVGDDDALRRLVARQQPKRVPDHRFPPWGKRLAWRPAMAATVSIRRGWATPKTATSLASDAVPDQQPRFCLFLAYAMADCSRCRWAGCPADGPFQNSARERGRRSSTCAQENHGSVP
jgi:hypothetical protein